MKIKLVPKIKEKSVIFYHGKDSFVLALPGGKKQINIGIGEVKEFNQRKLPTAIRKVISLAKSNKIKKLSLDFSDLIFPSLKLKNEELAEILTTNLEVANFEFIKYKTPPKEGWNFVEEVLVAGKITPGIKKGFEKGVIIGQEVNRARSLSNTPGGEMTPKILADNARQAMKNTAVKIKILDEKGIRKLKMGGIMGVAKGSTEKPRFIILEYWGGKKPGSGAPKENKFPTGQASSLRGKSEKPIVLVGKGVTFDTGGLNLKPSDGIYEMHMDMSGAAAVISTIALAARLKLKKNVVGLIPAVENMTSGSSYRPGDILKTMSGKTIEVLNTDAEGRIILADALSYAKKYKPKLVVDIATLTSAAVVALGQRASAIFTRDKKLENLFQALGEEAGEYVWPLPLWEEYEEDIKGTFGDWANIGKNRYGGAITGAMFLYQFAKDYQWVHLDIAPRMTSIDGEYLAKGAAGAPVRLLIKVLERM